MAAHRPQARRVKEAKATEPAAVKGLLAEALTELLRPLEKPWSLASTSPPSSWWRGQRRAGKTTSIGKLTRHLAQHDQKVLLAAADTFRAAAREQLTWGRPQHGGNRQPGRGDPPP